MTIAVSPLYTPRRRRRFVREEPLAFQLTDRDVAIVRLVAEHRFLSSTHISQLIEAPHKKVCDRLTGLFHAGYLDRPRAQFEHYREGGGSSPMIYALGNRGAGLLDEPHRRERASINWAQKNASVGRQFISHTLAIADVRVALATSIRRHPGYSILNAETLLRLAPEETRRRERPWLLFSTVPHNGVQLQVGVEPDHAFGIGDAKQSFRAFLVEVDRGTMPVARQQLAQSSFKRKILAYAQARRSLLHQHQFGWKTFRVLVVTSTKERADTILKTIRASAPEQEGFLFLVADRVSLAAADIIGYPWRDAKGATHGLIA